MRFLVAFAILATAFASSPDECAWGESYWCSSISNAKKCGAFDHCMDTVWKNTQLEKETTDVCAFCEAIIGDVRNFVDDKKNQDEVRTFLKNACNIIPDEQLSKMCKSTMDMDIDELIQMIDSELDAATICSAMGLCSGFDYLAEHRPVQKVDTDVCGFCEAILKDVRAFIDDPNNQQLVKNYLNQACDIIPSQEIAQLCKTAVEEDVKQLVEIIDTYLDPAAICKQLQLCSSSLMIPQGDDKCATCKYDFAEVAKIMANQTFQNVVKEMIQTNICPLSENWSQTCKQALEYNAVEMTMNSFSKFLAQYGAVACSWTGLCPANFIDLVRHQLPQAGSSSSNVMCDDCKLYMKEAADALMDDAFQGILTQFMKDSCSAILTHPEDCQMAVSLLSVKLMTSVSWELSHHGEQICSFTHMCPKEELFVSSIKERLVSNLKSTSPVKAGNAEECLICKTVIGELQNVDKDPATQKRMEDFIKQNVCAELGTLKETCENLVDTYAPLLFELLVSELDPESTCEELGFCPAAVAGQSIESVLRFAAHAPVPKSGPPKVPSKVSAAPSSQCVLCEFVIQTLDNSLGDNATEAEIIQALDKVCSALPDTLEKTCEQFVNQYGPTVIALLLQELDPQQVCQKLGLCAASVAVPVKDSTSCSLCEFVMTELDQILSENATESEIIGALDKVCSLLPSTITGECTDFVETYGRAVIALLAQELQPQAICSVLGLCRGPTKPMPIKAKVGGDEECGICETVIQYLDSLVEENATQEEIEAALDKICNFLPDTMKQQCDELVKEYGPAIIQMLAQYLDPREICTSIGLCSNKNGVAAEEMKKKMEEESNSIEPMIVPQKVKLLGEDDCTMGPAFWCLNMNNAKQCNAVEHCMKKVWN